MLPGPTLKQLTQSLSVGARVSVHRGKTTLVQDLPVQDVVLDATSARTVRRQLSFTTTSDFVPTNPLDRVNNFGHRVHVWMVLEDLQGVRFEVDLGWFLIEAWSENTTAQTMEVQAVDLLRLVETDVAAWPSSPPKNQRLRAEIQRLAGTTLAVVTTAPDTPVDPELQFQTDRLNNLTDLCLAYGLDYGMRPDGFLHVWPFRDTVVETYQATILSAPRESVKRKPNRWLAVGSKTEGSGDKAKETRWSFEAKNTVEPYGPDYGIVRDRIEVSSATSQPMVTNAANTQMKKDAKVFGFRSYEIVPDPRLELGDTAMFITEHDKTLGRVVAFSLPLDRPDGRQRVDVEIVG